MKTIHVLSATLLCATSLHTQAQLSSQASTNKIVEWVNTGWVEEETILSKALAIRVAKLEKASGIKFATNQFPKADLEHTVSVGNERNIAARYSAEKQWVEFPISMTYQLNVKYKTPLRLLDPNILADDESFAELADHELGHALSDQMSRKVGLGPFFTVEHFYSLSRNEQLGLNIIAEGIGMYFQRKLHPCNETLSAGNFPVSLDEFPPYPYEMITNQGGLWLVHDIIEKFGEKGLQWLVAHPIVAHTRMREVAVAYRNIALYELAK